MSYNPRHAIVRAVRSLPKWARAGILATAASGSIAGLAVAALPSGATISPTTIFTAHTGVAGYVTAPNANQAANGDQVSGVRSTFYLRNSMKFAQLTSPDVGVSLCRGANHPGAAAVLFTKWDPGAGVFDVIAGHSFSVGCTDPWSGISPSSLHVIDTVPSGHYVFLAITISKQHFVSFTDEDVTTNTVATGTFGGFTFGFTRSMVGTAADWNVLSTPATRTLVRFTKTSIRDDNGWVLINRAGLTRLVDTKVVASLNNNLAGAKIKPVKLVSDGFTLYEGQLIGS
ncbi:MAG: hypothetical protein J2P30_07545 [Actinobacteria bacterium]|nr:hypothetical protein [Actinomycetota bacterium]